MDIEKLQQEALKALEYSYSPYSKIKVGAALATDNGKIFVGSNIENASFSLTICAERVALFKAISAGHTNFEALLIVAKDQAENIIPLTPCGACRQALAEFQDDIDIFVLQPDGEIANYKLKTLLPERFEL